MQRNNRHNNLRVILATKMDCMLTLVQVVDLHVDVAGEIRACVDEALNAEEETLARLEVDTHGPQGDLELYSITWMYLFFLVVRVVRNHRGAAFWILTAM